MRISLEVGAQQALVARSRGGSAVRTGESARSQALNVKRSATWTHSWTHDDLHLGTAGRARLGLVLFAAHVQLVPYAS